MSGFDTDGVAVGMEGGENYLVQKTGREICFVCYCWVGMA